MQLWGRCTRFALSCLAAAGGCLSLRALQTFINSEEARLLCFSPASPPRAAHVESIILLRSSGNKRCSLFIVLQHYVAMGADRRSAGWSGKHSRYRERWNIVRGGHAGRECFILKTNISRLKTYFLHFHWMELNELFYFDMNLSGFLECEGLKCKGEISWVSLGDSDHLPPTGLRVLCIRCTTQTCFRACRIKLALRFLLILTRVRAKICW